MAAVSVCIPTFNHARFVGAAIDSARRQSFRDLEILVVDNCSEDETPSVVQPLVETDARVRYVRNERNLGLAGNFKRCLELASGQYIKFVCSDDSLEPACVERLLEAIRSRPGITLAACARKTVNEAGGVRGIDALAFRSAVIPGPEAIARGFFFGNRLGEPSAVLFRAADAGRGFNPAYGQLMDLEMWFHLLTMGALAYVAQPLCRVRRHTAQTSRANLRAGVVLKDKQALFSEFGRVVEPHASVVRRLCWDVRMASTIARAGASADGVAIHELREVFFPVLFRSLALPLARAVARATTAQLP